MQAGVSTPPASADVRSTDLDLQSVTHEQAARLRGERCARCGGSSNLRDAGHAYTYSKRSGRLGWPVRTCGSCPANWGSA